MPFGYCALPVLFPDGFFHSQECYCEHASHFPAVQQGNAYWIESSNRLSVPENANGNA